MCFESVQVYVQLKYHYIDVISRKTDKRAKVKECFAIQHWTSAIESKHLNYLPMRIVHRVRLTLQPFMSSLVDRNLAAWTTFCPGDSMHDIHYLPP